MEGSVYRPPPDESFYISCMLESYNIHNGTSRNEFDDKITGDMVAIGTSFLMFLGGGSREAAVGLRFGIPGV